MRRAIVALFAIICGILFPHLASCADYVTGDVYGGLIHFDQDVYISNGVVAAYAVYADSSLTMVNTAFIRSDIYICDNCDFRIQNSGNISGSIHLGNGAVMTQIVCSGADVTFLDVDAPYIVLADGVNDVSWTDLSLLGANAGTLVLRDSDVVFSNTGLVSTFRGGQTSKIFLDGVITLRLPQDYYAHSGRPLMRNVYGVADIVITGASPGDLFAYVAKIENGDLYVKTVRETDYYKILGNERGYFLNLLRENYPDDALLRRLDSAQNMTELNAIMSRSVALNPIKLAEPMFVLDKFMAADMAVSGVCADDAIGMSGRPFYIKNSDFNIYGISADFSFGDAGGFLLGGAIYGAMAESDDEINAFSSQMFGGRIFAGLGGDAVNMRGTVGLTYADFDVPYVFDNGRVHNNLHAVSTYAVADMGFPVGIVAPFVGAEYHAAYMLDERDVSSALRIGIETGLEWSGETVDYECVATAAANTAAEQMFGVKAGFFSSDDMIGGDVSINVIHAGNSLSGMFSFSAKIRF